MVNLAVVLRNDSKVYAVLGRKNRQFYGVRFYALAANSLLNITPEVAKAAGVEMGKSPGSKLAYGPSAMLERRRDVQEIIGRVSVKLGVRLSCQIL